MHRDRDAALVKRCRCGDRQAMSELVACYHRPVFNAAYRIVGNLDDAADVTQVVFLKVFDNLETYDPKFKFFSWVYRIAINESLNQVKKRRHREPLPEEPVSPWPGPDEVLESSTLCERVQEALMRLSDEYRVVVVLKHLSGFSYRQISTILHLPEKTVKSRLYTARQSMKNILLSQSAQDPGASSHG